VTLSQDHCKAQNGLLPSEAAMPERAMMREHKKGRTTGTFRTVSLFHRPRGTGVSDFRSTPVLVGIRRTSYVAATLWVCAKPGPAYKMSIGTEIPRLPRIGKRPLPSAMSSLARAPEPSSFRKSRESRGPGYDPGSRSGCRLIPSFLISPSPLLPERPTSLVCRA
jgi:hypothetical protein